MNNFILVGFKGSGKSTLGKKLASQLKYAFIDIDCLISSNCHDFYKTYGEKAFREAEKKAIFSLKDVQKAVIATGGGALLDPENVCVLKKIGRLIYLKEDKQIIKKRLLTPPYPAFFAGKDLEREFEEMYAQRSALYEESADDWADPNEDLWEVIHSEPCFRLQLGASRMEKPSVLSSTDVRRD